MWQWFPGLLPAKLFSEWHLSSRAVCPQMQAGSCRRWVRHTTSVGPVGATDLLPKCVPNAFLCVSAGIARSLKFHPVSFLWITQVTKNVTWHRFKTAQKEPSERDSVFPPDTPLIPYSWPASISQPAQCDTSNVRRIGAPFSEFPLTAQEIWTVCWWM